jgi:integrase
MPPRERSLARFLNQAVVRQSTRRKYLAAVRPFIDFCVARGRDFDSLTPAVIDDHLCGFLHSEYLRRRGTGKSFAQQLFFGLLFLYPFLRTHLTLSYQALRGWSKLAPTVSYPPLSWECACAVAVCMVRRGRFPSAVAVLLAHSSFLRISEVVGLRVCDVAVANDARLPAHFQGVALRLMRTKTGNNQWATVLEKPVQDLVALWLEGARVAAFSRRSLLGLSADVLRRHFRDACDTLGLDSRFVFHSLRHGRATHEHLAGRRVEDVMILGRWASLKSARIYIQSGAALALTATVPRRVAAVGRVFANNLLLSISNALSQ